MNDTPFWADHSSNEKYYRGIVTVLNQKNVRTFYDVTKIKDIPATDIRPSVEGGQPPRDILIKYLPQIETEGNSSSENEEENQNIKHSVKTNSPDSDYRSIIERNIQREQTRVVLG